MIHVFHKVLSFFLSSEKTIRLPSSVVGWDVDPADLQRCEQHSLLTQALVGLIFLSLKDF